MAQKQISLWIKSLNLENSFPELYGFMKYIAAALYLAGIFLYFAVGTTFFSTRNYYVMPIHCVILIELIYGYIQLIKYLQTQKK